MNKSYVLRLTRRLFTLVALVGCLLMLAPTQAKADWLDCIGDYFWCSSQCYSGSEFDACLDQCGQTFFICEASSNPTDPPLRIVP